ncbi:MAG: hypothetical protein NZ956_00440 [Candidatus Caldarchaeum sp.]|nr:hypothetical protein [Candidatus Caldarchaeum sp.]
MSEEELVGEAATFELLDDNRAVLVSGDIGWFKERGYGDIRQDGRYLFSPVETLYLVKNGKASVFRNGEKQEFNTLLTRFIQHDRNVWRDYVIYVDLRKRRYVVKEGFGPKLRFRVFERGEYLEKPAKYLIIPLYEGESIGMSELLSLLRSCRAMDKTGVVAVLDRRNEVVYYQASVVELWNK